MLLKELFFDFCFKYEVNVIIMIPYLMEFCEMDHWIYTDINYSCLKQFLDVPSQAGVNIILLISIESDRTPSVASVRKTLYHKNHKISDTQNLL